MAPENDVIVIGAGLAGLAAAIALQAAGRRVTIIERADRTGGLCGSRIIDGYSFTIACNDFGHFIVDAMAGLGVHADFTRPRSLLCTTQRTYQLPIGPATVWPLLRETPDLIRFVRTLRRGIDSPETVFVGDVLDAVKGGTVADLIGIWCWAFGTPPHRFRCDKFAALFARNPGYGYDRMVTPVGGPQALVDAMTNRFTELGGEIELGSEVLDVEAGPEGKAVSTANGVRRARHVISSQSRFDRYPSGTVPGLAIGTLHIAADGAAPFPAGVHTVAHVPDGIPEILNRLDTGELPDDIPFTVFPCGPSGSVPADRRTFNAYFLFPRGVDELGVPERNRIEHYLLARLESMIPGFTARIRYRRLVSPLEFTALHGVPSYATPVIIPPGCDKPDGYDPVRDIHYIGNHVQPVGEHACGAIASGLRAAETVAMANDLIPR
ncbi:phytoene desaturase family protein [Nocardia sp. NPDC006044]|uniref:phytoene desaturase family protein n=1 Tax=Nocardia sp. NPDC006044 TaxID=3364306 RepID=UPI0036B4F355